MNNFSNWHATRINKAPWLGAVRLADRTWSDTRVVRSNDKDRPAALVLGSASRLVRVVKFGNDHYVVQRGTIGPAGRPIWSNKIRTRDNMLAAFRHAASVARGNEL